MKKKNINKRIFKLPVLILLVTSILLVFGSSIFTSSKSFFFTRLDDGWSVKRGNETYENVTLSTFNFGYTKKGEVITITGTLPDQTVVAPTIMFKSALSTVSVRLDGEMIYSYGQDYDEKGMFVPKKYHVVTLNDETGPHDLEITFTVSENNGFRYLNPVYFGNRGEVIREFIQTHRLPIFIGGFLAMYSCLQLSLAFYLFLSHRKDLSLVFNSVISMLLAVYIYGYNDIFCFISDHDYLLSLTEYISLYLIPLLITVLLYSTHRDIATLRQKILITVNIIFPLVFILLHFSGIAHFSRFVEAAHVILLIETACILPPIIKGVYLEHKEKINSMTYTGIDADVYLLLGFIFLIMFSILEIVKFNMISYTDNNSAFTNINFLTLGVLYFIICLFIYYFLNSIDHMNSKYIKQRLKGLAYTDSLTGLMNRAKCMQYMASVNEPYALVCLDLDRLKFVNDNYGHMEGDKMIKAFADILVKAFAGAQLIGRTGGDEFLVAIENPSSDICGKCVQALEQYMSEYNKAGERFTLSASAGYAYSNELPGGRFDDIFYLADSRMYEMKERHHHA